MKTKNKIFVTLLAALTLLGSLSFSLQRMECLISGNTMYSITGFDCCSNDRSSQTISSKCCDLKSFDFEGENFIRNKVKPSNNQTKTIVPIVNPDAVENIQFSSRNLKSNFNIPPPWVDIDYQVLFQSFLC